jgi:RarD protein
MKIKASGNAIAVVNFVMWGLLPLYYQYMTLEDIFELFSVRILASVPFLVLCFYALKQPFPAVKSLLADKRSCFMLAIAAVFISISWCTFTFAITHNHVMEASLGFFIAPLFVFAFGIFVQREKPDGYKLAAIFLAIIGVSYQVYWYKEVPMISLVMAFFFSLYGLCKKYVKFNLMVSMMIETLVCVPFAMGYLLWSWTSDHSQLAHSDWVTWALFIGSTPMTIIPYLLYTAAVQRTSLTMMGLLHYIEPSLQFLLAYFYFREPFDHAKGVSFGFIWLGLIICSIPLVVKIYQQNMGKFKLL